MKVLITGGGYVGSYLAGLILQDSDYEVRVIDNFHKGNCDAIIPYCANDRFEFMFGDITSKEDCQKMVKGVDAIIHTAALVGFPSCRKYPVLSKLINVIGTSNLVESRPKDIPLFFTSTGSVYGALEEICTEESPTNPKSEYGQHKLWAEKILLEHDSTYIYRYATAFGVSPSMRVNLLINDLVFQAVTNKALVIFQADFARTFIHLKDMSRALKFGLDSIFFGVDKEKVFSKEIKLHHRLYNVGHPDNNWTKREVAEAIKRKTGCVTFYEDLMEDADLRNYSVNFDRLLNEGFDPKIKVEDGIDELIKCTPLIQINRNYQ
jgi:nucleoside-diphosphate-sugar epimerase